MTAVPSVQRKLNPRALERLRREAASNEELRSAQPQASALLLQATDEQLSRLATDRNGAELVDHLLLKSLFDEARPRIAAAALDGWIEALLITAAHETAEAGSDAPQVAAFARTLDALATAVRTNDLSLLERNGKFRYAANTFVKEAGEVWRTARASEIMHAYPVVGEVVQWIETERHRLKPMLRHVWLEMLVREASVAAAMANRRDLARVLEAFGTSIDRKDLSILDRKGVLSAANGYLKGQTASLGAPKPELMRQLARCFEADCWKDEFRKSIELARLVLADAEAVLGPAKAGWELDAVARCKKVERRLREDEQLPIHYTRAVLRAWGRTEAQANNDTKTVAF